MPISYLYLFDLVTISHNATLNTQSCSEYVYLCFVAYMFAFPHTAESGPSYTKYIAISYIKQITIPTDGEVLKCLLHRRLCSLARRPEISEDVDTRCKVNHVLFTTARGKLKELIDVYQRWTKDITYISTIYVRTLPNYQY